MLAVVVGHTSFVGIPSSIVDFCYSFDMPLFFILSGYFCKGESLSRSFVLKNIKALLFPYIITSVIIIAVMTARDALFGYSEPMASFASWSIAALYASGSVVPGMPTGVIAIGAIWYLFALFWAKLLLASIEETDHPALIALILFVIGIYTKDAIWLPLAIQPALCATLFLYIGKYIKENDTLNKLKSQPLLYICIVATWLYCGAFYGKLYMVTNTYANGPIDVIGGVCGSITILLFGQFLSDHAQYSAKLLSLIGRNTLPLFCMHLVELNAIDWSALIQHYGGVNIHAGLAGLLVHAVSICLLSFVLFILPKRVSGVFFKSRRVMKPVVTDNLQS